MSDDPIRILQCVTCRTLEVLPGYRGPADHDPWLPYLLGKHRFPDGSAHFGNLIPATVSTTDGKLRPATMADWNNPKFQDLIKKDLADKATRPGTGSGLGQVFYDTRDSFREDAMRCFNKHRRPKGACQDYKTAESQRLLPDTAAERKEAGLGKPTSNRFICEFCPVETHMITQRRKAAGMYN